MARKSRKVQQIDIVESSLKMTEAAIVESRNTYKKYRVAVYARLSFESDSNRERDTVDTQIRFIEDYVSKHSDMEVVAVYADISFTGTNFERPEFSRMMEDMKAGKFNTIVTKDLSRLGRNYIDAGTFIERIFPLFNIRYIAITDEFDTEKSDMDLAMPLKNMVNEFYSKDLSDKVWSAYRSVWHEGKYVHSRPPYGYKKNRETKSLEIDEYAADIVKRIFKLYLEGYDFAEIAEALRNDGVLSPSRYRYRNAGDNVKENKARDWYFLQVKNILRDQQYVGDSVHGKLAYKMGETPKGSHPRRQPKENWIIIPNTHEAIITRDDFKRAEERMKSNEQKRKDNIRSSQKKAPSPKNLFVKKCTCGECGSPVYIGRKDHGSNHFYYKCECLTEQGKNGKCKINRVKIPHEELEDSVFAVIKKHMQTCVDQLELVRNLNQSEQVFSRRKYIDDEIIKMHQEVQRLHVKEKGLYEDYCDRLITSEEYIQFQKEYRAQIQAKEQEISRMESEKKKYASDYHMNLDWEQLVEQYIKKRKLTKEMVDAFVSAVVIYRDKSAQVTLYYDDILADLIQIAKEREAEGYE